MKEKEKKFIFWGFKDVNSQRNGVPGLCFLCLGGGKARPDRDLEGM